jgi:broad specificity phosphatase PhoE
VRIFIVRHGQTDANLRHELQGRRDIPLNAKGREQAESMHAFFERKGVAFGRVFSSPLLRALETARIISGGAVPIEADERLLEMDYGPYEGMNLRSPAPEITAFFSDFAHNPAPAGMEQLASVVARGGAFMESLASRARAGELTGDVLVATHAIEMKGILEYLTPGSDGSYWSRFIGNCAVYRVDLRDGKLGVPEEVFNTERP